MVNMDKVSPQSVDLRPTKLNVAKRCATCTMFRETSETCTLVAGHILPSDVCDRYEPR